MGNGAHHEGLGPALQLRGDLDLGRGSAGDQEALVHEAADHAEGVVQAALNHKYIFSTPVSITNWGLGVRVRVQGPSH